MKMMSQLNIWIVMVLVAIGVVNAASSSSLRMKVSSKQGSDIACCQDDCKSAICVPPFVSICSRCGIKSHEKVLINQFASDEAIEEVANSVSKPDPDKKTDCCNDKCNTAICVPPFVAICSGCKGAEVVEESSAVIEEQPTVQSAVDVPYKHCCDTSCKTQLCVPPFVAVCLGCKDKSMESVTAII